jgi:DNA polymerase I
MGAYGLCDYAQEAYNIFLTMEQSETFRQKFFDLYTGIAAWHETLNQTWETETRTILGRRRQWEDSPGITKLSNSPDCKWL